MDYEFESITPWNGEHDTGRDARLKLDRNFAKIKSNFEELAGSRYVTTGFFARLFAPEGEDGAEVDANDMEAVITAVRVKFGLYTDSYISAKGNNPESGSTVAGASALVDLSDVAISNPQDGQIFAWDAARQKWVNADAPSAGLDEAALAEYLTTNHYAKTTDIPSLEGYATQSWASGQFALKTVAINAGTGLTGGGNLSASRTLSLATVGTAGTYTKVTVDAYGRVTGHGSLAAGDIPALAISKITGLQAVLDAKMDAADFEELFEKVYVSGYGYAIRAKLALYTDSWMSAKGSNPDAGSVVTGGIDEEELAEYLTTHGYATQSWVNQQGFLKSVAWGDVTGKPSPLANDQYYYGHGQLTTDFNAAVKGGAYFTAREAWPSNGPGTSYRYGALAVFHTGTDNTRVAQLWMSHSASSAGGVYVRMKYEQADGNWQPWARLLDNNCIGSYALTPSNYTNYTVTKTGGGASGTWAIGISGNAATATSAVAANRLATARTIWGQPFNGTANVSGALTGVTTLTASGNIKGSAFFLTTGGGLYWVNGTTYLDGREGENFQIRTSGGISIPTLTIYATTTKFNGSIQIGNGTISWDSTNNCFHFSNGLYSDEFISAKGINSSSGSVVAGASALSELDDVSISNPVDGQALIRRNGVWKNETVNGGGSSSVAWVDVTGKPSWIPDTDGSGSGIDADLLDGTHKSGLFTAMTYMGSTLSLTIGGVRKTVNIETSAVIPTVSVSSTSSRNLSVNVGGSTDYVNDLYATYSTYADYLRTARTIWGQSFNGGNSVSGALTGVTTITASGNIKGSAFFLTTGGGLYWVNGTTYLDGREGENFQIRTSGGISIPTLTIYATTTKFNGTVYATGGFQNGSDIRYKHVLQDLALTVAQVAAAPSFLFRWTDGTADGVQAGTSAQYWQQVMPQVVMESAGRLSMQYDKAALAAAIAVAKSVIDHEERIKRLENMIS